MVDVMEPHHGDKHSKIGNLHDQVTQRSIPVLKHSQSEDHTAHQLCHHMNCHGKIDWQDVEQSHIDGQDKSSHKEATEESSNVEFVELRFLSHLHNALWKFLRRVFLEHYEAESDESQEDQD